MKFDDYLSTREPFEFEGQEFHTAVMTRELFAQFQALGEQEAKIAEAAQEGEMPDADGAFDLLEKTCMIFFNEPDKFKKAVLDSPKIGLAEMKTISKWAQEQVMGGIEVEEAPL